MKLMVLLTLLYTGTIVSAQNAQYNYDRDANFAAYKTYQWVEHERRIADQLFDNDIRWDPLESTCRHASLSIL